MDMSLKEAAQRIREHTRFHALSEPSAIKITTALLMGADALEAQNAEKSVKEQLASKLASVTRERDAAVSDLARTESCIVCRRTDKCDPNARCGTRKEATFRKCRDGSIIRETQGRKTKGLWEWRGLCADNAPEGKEGDETP
jgi:hypothetical protein